MSFFFSKNRELEGKTGPVWGFGTSERRTDKRKECRRMNLLQVYMKMEK
jgi:hypothetical protein